MISSVAELPVSCHADHAISFFPHIEEVSYIFAEKPLAQLPIKLKRLKYLFLNDKRPPRRVWQKLCCFAGLCAANPRPLTRLSLFGHEGKCTAVLDLLRSCQSTLQEVCVMLWTFIN